MINVPASLIPKHIAIIMDGNGKWAKKWLLPKYVGHRKGAEAAKEIAQACKRLGVEYLTLYVFSSENWRRPQEEVDGVMGILRDYLQNYTSKLMEEGMRIEFIGDLSLLPADIKQMVDEVSEMTKNNKFRLIFALSYGSRDEIKKAVIDIAHDAIDGKIVPEQVNFADYLYTKSIPDPDLLIRTGGEYRISNFLLYQISYSELYFIDVLWPDFREANLIDAIKEYARRERRYGKRLNESN